MATSGITRVHTNGQTQIIPYNATSENEIALAIEAVDCIPLEGQDRLFLLPGHVGFAEYEVTLGIAQELGKETAAFETWIQKIEEDVSSKLVPVLRRNSMMLPEQTYIEQGIGRSFCLTKISNFNSLIALSQEHRTPIYALTAQQLRQTGVVLQNNQAKQAEFRQTFADLADKIIGLTSAAYAISA